MSPDLPLSAVNQMAYCAHRAFLIHRCGEMWANEHVWRGRALHRRVDRGRSEVRATGRLERSRPVRSVVLGVVGVIDQLEHDDASVRIVEFKRGQAPREGVWPNDRLQIAVQAMCLREEGVEATEGCVYYQRSAVRRFFAVSEELLEQASRACFRLRAIMSGAEPTRPSFGRRCQGCSLFEICLPQANSESLWAEHPEPGGSS